MQVCSQNKGEGNLRKRNPLQKSLDVNLHSNHNLNNANRTPQILFFPNILVHYPHNYGETEVKSSGP